MYSRSGTRKIYTQEGVSQFAILSIWLSVCVGLYTCRGVYLLCYPLSRVKRQRGDLQMVYEMLYLKTLCRV